MHNQYKISQVKTDTASLQEVADLLNASFPAASKFTVEFLTWQYKENPIGEIIGFNAYMGDAIAAHYVTMPILMNINGLESIGLLSLNTATHPNHRGKNLFTILANRTYEYAKEAGFAYVIGVANANSTHGFVNRLGFELVGPLSVSVGSGKIIAKEGYEYRRIWDKKTLNWRLNCPLTSYQIKNNLIVNSDKFWGINLIMGVLENNIDLEYSRKHLINPFNLYIGLGAKLSNGLYFQLPKIIKRPPFNLIFKDLSGKIAAPSRDNILFQLIDFDVA